MLYNYFREKLEIEKGSGEHLKRIEEGVKLVLNMNDIEAKQAPGKSRDPNPG